MPADSLQERRSHGDRRSSARRATEVATRLATRRGDVLVLLTTRSFTVHVVGLVSTDGQQDFHTCTNVKYVLDHAAAIAEAKTLVKPGRRILLRDIDTDRWSEIPH
jgi:hypothetical protein